MKNKILSLLTAFAMVLSVLVAPFAPANAADDETTDAPQPEVTTGHKTDVVVHKMELKDLEGWPKKADAEGADNSKYDGSKLSLGYFGKGAKELKDVKFTYWEVSKDQYDELTKNSSFYDTKAKVTEKYADLGEGTEVITTAEGATITGLVDGYYWFVEDQDSVSRDGKTFSGAAAVPFGLSLPYAKADGKPFGQGDDSLHVYPKNTLAGEPKVDKDFKGKANPGSPRTEEEKNKPEAHNVGDKIPYEVKTVFQPNTKYKTAFWTDQMTEGLTFDQDSLTVKVGDKALTKDTDYTLDITVNTFKVTLTEDGLKNVNEQKEATEVTIEYTATLTNKAVVDVPESNDVIFHYGNNPSQGNTPVPNKPDNGKITFTKTWDGTAPIDAEITVQLYNANTGAKVGDAKALNAENNWKAEWTELDNDTEYKVVETGVNGYDAEYTKGEGLGELGAKNWKTNNPKPINPNEPKVVTRGRKFVKMEKGKDVRLEGAEFVIKNSDGQYLQPSNGADKKAFEKAQKAYSDAVSAYNKLTAEQQTDEAKKNVQDKADARDKAWNDYLSNMTSWGGKKTALKLKSDEAGAFEIKGLKDGKYSLEETKAPDGYADIKEDIEFELKEGSYTTGDINYNPLVKGKDAQRVNNTKITIPQTGGIGSIIFIVAGLLIMGLAGYKMKANKEQA